MKKPTYAATEILHQINSCGDFEQLEVLEFLLKGEIERYEVEVLTTLVNELHLKAATLWMNQTNM